ncbi:MAG TPA: hypothetical protein VEQ66_16550 [Propionibacteriaceae bacterium]|nr:hypothetical protein [Propionibacteriaceae bacterium]
MRVARPAARVREKPLAGPTLPGRTVEISTVDLLVVGAHLSGQPLNHNLLACKAALVGQVRTAPTYRLWALNTVPPKPGLLRVNSAGGAISGERWRMPAIDFGALVAALPPPMTIGSVQLDDGSKVLGFLVEAAATAQARDITAYGGWRAYLARRQP